ncbi:ABC transporter permease [Streptomyces sp. NPDC093707]|uniref:ABC transporter permease n=1 Tax=Streptomyces sp. NPDC093707 TaxID=3154984 RepID=UPI00344F5227
MLKTLTGLAMADFRDRVRRPAYLAVLAAAVALGYVAVPDADTPWMIMQVGDHRGIYNSAYVGMVTALAAGLWITLGGFSIVRNSIERDRSTRVGQLLAATPLRTPAYLAGKFLSNLLVLASMLGVLAVTALVMQLARGESREIDPVALWQPFVLIALPLVALTAALALLFESLPVLRTGVGTVLWFGVWLVVAVAGQGPGLPLDGIGVNSVARSMAADMAARHVHVTGSFSLGLTYLDKPLGLFTWHGFTPTAGYVLGRVALLLIAALLALLPALWFGRFDPARGRGHRAADEQAQARAGGTAPPGTAQPAAVQPVFLDEAGLGPASGPTLGRVLRTRPERGAVSLRLWAGEVRVLLQGVRWWWWLGAALLVVCGLTAPALHGVTRVMLPLAWIWPVLIWSRLGTQRHEHGVEGMLGACPAVRRRVLAEWAAGLTVTAAAGIGPLVRVIAAGDWLALAGWTGGALFIPSLAMALGTLSRTHRLFQAVYVPLWYSVANGLPLFDFMGALRDSSELATVQPPMTVLAAAALMAVVLATTALRRFGRD